jgi:hypothetical protein
MSDHESETLVTSTMATIGRIADRVVGFTSRVLRIVAVAAIGSFALGLAALQGGIRTVWIVLGGAFALIAVCSAVSARLRVGSVRRHAGEIAGEIRALLAGRGDSHRLIREFRDSQSPGDPAAGGSVIVVSHQFDGLRRLAGSDGAGAPRLAAAITSFVRVPVLTLVAVAIAVVFIVLAPIFLLALAV